LSSARNPAVSAAVSSGSSIPAPPQSPMPDDDTDFLA
jgi:hypothetical protein